MTTHNDTIEAFKATARPLFGTISGNATTGFRIAVRNITGYRQVAALVEQFGGTIAESTRRFPELVKITFPVCDRCGAVKPTDQSCGCFDNGGQ